jgi:hypothetical protein
MERRGLVVKARWVGGVLAAVLGGCAGSPPPLSSAAIGAISPLVSGRVLAVVVRSPRSSAELEAVDWAALQVREAREGALERIRSHCQLAPAETLQWRLVSLEERARPLESLSEAERELIENLPGTQGYIDD